MVPSPCEIIKDMVCKNCPREEGMCKPEDCPCTLNNLPCTDIYVCHSDEQCISIVNNAVNDDSDKE